MQELREENKGLRSKLNDEPRRKAPAARKTPVKAPTKIETTAQALTFLDAQGVSDERIEAYRNAVEGDRRKPILGKMVISIAQEHAVNN